MELVKIPLPVAYMVETLRCNGVTNEDILAQIEKKDVSPWNQIHDRFDFTKLLQIAEEDMEAFRSLLYDGYTVKFITIRGLQNLLKLRFNLLADEDYELTETGIANLRIKPDQLAILRQMLSPNCVLHENEDDTISITLS